MLVLAPPSLRRSQQLFMVLSTLICMFGIGSGLSWILWRLFSVCSPLHSCPPWRVAKRCYNCKQLFSSNAPISIGRVTLLRIIWCQWGLAIWFQFVGIRLLLRRRPWWDMIYHAFLIIGLYSISYAFVFVLVFAVFSRRSSTFSPPFFLYATESELFRLILFFDINKITL